MAHTAADVLIETLQDWAVDTVFGMPGDGINGIMEALRTRREQIRFVQVRHEEAAAFMACAYAKFTGRLGVCLATSGPGGIHLLNGLYDAKLDGQPVLAITGLSSGTAALPSSGLTIGAPSSSAVRSSASVAPSAPRPASTTIFFPAFRISAARSRSPSPGNDAPRARTSDVCSATLRLLRIVPAAISWTSTGTVTCATA